MEEQGPRAGRALVALLERTGGLDIFTGMLAGFWTPATVPAVGAFVTGLLSAFSSTSDVVLPAFLPTVSGLVAKLGGGDPVAIAASMSIGAQSPTFRRSRRLARCASRGPPARGSSGAVQQLLAWGMSMSIASGALCYMLFSVF